MKEKRWFIWWVSRQEYIGQRWVDTGSWFGPQYLTDREAWRLEFDISSSNFGAKPYRMMWSGYEWIYDQRTGTVMLAP